LAFLSLPYLAQLIIQVHPFSCKWHNFVLLHGWIICIVYI
jgi:hypothetical protein